MKQALETGHLETVVSIMSQNQQILIDLGLSNGTLVYFSNMALEKGALGAKVTGGGRGGYMVALTPGKVLQQIVAEAMEKKVDKVIRAIIGN